MDEKKNSKKNHTKPITVLCQLDSHRVYRETNLLYKYRQNIHDSDGHVHTNKLSDTYTYTHMLRY